MILSDSEEILVIIAGAAILMAILGNVVKDYKSMKREAKQKVAQKEKDEAYIKKLTTLIDLKNKELQKKINHKDQ
jgi:flagellar motor component MotA